MSHNFIQINKEAGTVTVPSYVLGDLYAAYITETLGSDKHAAARSDLRVLVMDWAFFVGEDTLNYLATESLTNLRRRGADALFRLLSKKEQSNESV